MHTRKKGDAQNGKNLAIRMRINYAGTAIDFPTGLNINAAFWNTKEQCALNGFEGKSGQKAVDINRTIDEYRTFANEIFARYELLEKRIPSSSEVKSLFNDMVGRSKINLPNPSESFFAVFDIFIQTMSEQNQWAKSTYQKFTTIREHLFSFDNYLNFHIIDESKMQKYVQWLYKKDLRNTTIAKNIDCVRWFLRWAARKGYYNGNLHETFKPKFKGIDGNSKEIIFLTHDELQSLQNFVGKEYLEHVRDVFLFCCFTGLRYSDVAQLTKTDISHDTIKIVTQKTSESLTIELNKHSKAILNKYKNIKFAQDKALPIISNAKMNLYLKELGRQCELNTPQKIVYFQGNTRKENIYPKWTLLTTHCARRTFVVNAFYLGIPSEVIMRWTGHADFKAMKPYIKIVDELKEREMSKFDQF